MARVVGRVGLRTITMALFVCGFGTVGRTRLKEGLGTTSLAGGSGRVGENGPGGWYGRFRDYN
jgi:hypothetical protein